MASSSLPEIKDRLRSEAFGRRDALDKDVRREAAQRIARRALDFPDLRTVTPVGGYWPIRSEVDPRPLMEALLGRGQDVALSQILHPHLSFRQWQPGDVLVKGGFGVREPGPDAPEVFPKALLVRWWRSTGEAAASATARAISTAPSRPSRKSTRFSPLGLPIRSRKSMKYPSSLTIGCSMRSSPKTS